MCLSTKIVAYHSWKINEYIKNSIVSLKTKIKKKIVIQLNFEIF